MYTSQKSLLKFDPEETFRNVRLYITAAFIPKNQRSASCVCRNLEHMNIIFCHISFLQRKMWRFEIKDVFSNL